MDRDEFKAFEGRIDNWRAAYRVGMHYGQCASVEGRYRGDAAPPRGEEVSAPRLVDAKDAALLEDAWKTLMAPWAKWMIKWHFIAQNPRLAVLRMTNKRYKRGITADSYELHLRAAVELMKKNLDMRSARQHNQLQQFDPTSSGAYGSQAAAFARR